MPLLRGKRGTHGNYTGDELVCTSRARGLYAAKEQGYYNETGLDMTIQAGGPQVSPTQIVASGKAQFGLATADQLLVAREEGIPLVAIATIFQKSPQGLMVHANQNMSSWPI